MRRELDEALSLAGWLDATACLNRALRTHYTPRELMAWDAADLEAALTWAAGPQPDDEKDD